MSLRDVIQKVVEDLATPKQPMTVEEVEAEVMNLYPEVAQSSIASTLSQAYFRNTLIHREKREAEDSTKRRGYVYWFEPRKRDYDLKQRSRARRKKPVKHEYPHNPILDSVPAEPVFVEKPIVLGLNAVPVEILPAVTEPSRATTRDTMSGPVLDWLEGRAVELVRELNDILSKNTNIKAGVADGQVRLRKVTFTDLV